MPFFYTSKKINQKCSESDFALVLVQQTTTIQVVDMQGRPMNAFSFSGNEKTIEVSDWADGIYFYHVIQDGKKLKTSKIMVQK